ncbi:signal peptidase I [Paenibacillus wynnii]|uniref:signal peptidase I n=1 Tax=Paenibacillus wynnii TaxID=268407 RepID=UPI0006916C18|nr:signal peptidase I [Paenibacillus wynnii]
MKAEYYSAAICRAMDRLGFIELRSTGTSMFPFIHERDTCFFRSFEPTHVKPGDVLLFINDEGALVCHRVIKVNKEHNEAPAFIICKGDTNLLPDPPVPSGQVIGKLTHIRKRWLTLSPDNGLGRLWGKLIIGMPPFAYILHRVARLYRWRSNYLSTRP